MKEIEIRGKLFSEEEVCYYGKKSRARTRLILLLISASCISTGAICLPALFDEGLFGTIFTLFLLPGAIFAFLALIKGVKNPYKEGLAYLKKHFPYPVGFDGNIIDLLDGDKTLELSETPVNKVIILSSENKFQICNENKYSKIYTGKEILEYQIKVDNEVVISSSTRNKKGVGKVIVGGVLFGAAGAIAGAVTANKNSNSSQSQKEVQHYTFVLKVNDILKPAYVLELPSLAVAEEIAATFEIIYQESVQWEEDVEALEEQAPEATDEKFNPNKFEEIKKYKELLDLGIISQEEFEIEKKRILG